MALPAELVPPDVTYEVEPGRQAPVAEHPFIKEAPDVPTFLKRVIDTHREVGSRIPIKIERVRNADGTFGPKVEAVEQWRKDHLPKLYDAGVLDRPITDPAQYEIKKPEHLAEGVNWSDERASRFASIGVKYGIPKAAMQELHKLHVEGVEGLAKTLQTSYDETMLALKREYGDKFDERLEQAKRFNKLIFKNPEEIAFMEETGLGNHPILTSILMRLAPYAQNDSSLVEALKETGVAPGSVPNVEAEREKIRAELGDIMSNKDNPRHLGYLRGDKGVSDYIDSLYAKIYGTGQVEIGTNSGITFVKGA
jgi:hypothetical protein